MERISLRRVVFVSFVVGGLAAGLAGASQVIGRHLSWSLYATLGLVTMLGFNGIGVDLIGRNHPIGGIFALYFSGGVHGGRFMEYDWGIPCELKKDGIIRNPVDANRVKEYMLVVKEARKKH